MSTKGTKIRFGIVGTGGIANTQATGLAALGDDAELVAVCDVDPTRVADFSERWGVRHQYDSARPTPSTPTHWYWRLSAAFTASSKSLWRPRSRMPTACWRQPRSTAP